MPVISSYSDVASEIAVSLIMTVGSFVAGFTALGGGAVAFPFFTKVLSVAPADARTFSLMIQAVGMTMATVIIFINRKDIERLLLSRLAAVAGASHVATHYLVPDFAPVFNRIIFTGLVLSFALLIVTLEKSKDAKKDQVQVGGWPLDLMTGALVGGAISYLLGTGADVIIFIILVFGYKFSFARATAYSVVLMASNSVVGALFHVLVLGDVEPVINWWLAAIPVVIIGAPLGAWACTKVSHQAAVRTLFALIAIEVMSTFILIKATSSRVLVLLATSCFVLLLARFGYRQSSRVLSE